MHEMALRSGCTPGMAGASKALKFLLFDGGDWADPEVRKFRFFLFPPPAPPRLASLWPGPRRWGGSNHRQGSPDFRRPSCNQGQRKSGVPGVSTKLSNQLGNSTLAVAPSSFH